MLADTIMAMFDRSFIVGLVAGVSLYGIYSHVVGRRKDEENEEKQEQIISTVTSLHPLQANHPAYKGCIYLDYNATTPIYSEVKAAMDPYLSEHFGNPSSTHLFGPVCKQAIQLARQQMGDLLHIDHPQEEIIFTSCGTESDNRAIDIAIDYYHAHTTTPNLLPHVITSQIEHPAILCYLRELQTRGKLIFTAIPVNAQGVIHLSALTTAYLPQQTVLITIMHSNNEIGAIQPIRAIAHCIQQFNQQRIQAYSLQQQKEQLPADRCQPKQPFRIIFHSDLAQSIGKLPLDVQYLGVDMATIVGHKFGAPKGIAALYLRQGCCSSSVSLSGSGSSAEQIAADKESSKVKAYKIPSLLVGGGQEHGRRAGTENVAYIVGLGEACRLAQAALSLSQQPTLQQPLSLPSSANTANYLLHLLTCKLTLLQCLQAEEHFPLAIYASTNSYIQYHGPTRSYSITAIQDDIKMMKVMIRSSCSSSSSTTTTGATDSKLEQGISTILECLPNTLSLSFRGLIGHEIVSALQETVAISAGSACHAVPSSSGGKEVTYSVSEVMQAIQVPQEVALGTIRISCGRYTTMEEMKVAVERLSQVVKEMWQAKKIVVVGNI